MIWVFCVVLALLCKRNNQHSNDESKLTLGYQASSNQPHHTLVQGSPWSAASTVPRPTQNTTLCLTKYFKTFYLSILNLFKTNFRI